MQQNNELQSTTAASELQAAPEAPSAQPIPPADEMQAPAAEGVALEDAAAAPAESPEAPAPAYAPAAMPAPEQSEPLPPSRGAKARMRVRSAEGSARAALARREALPPLTVGFLFFLLLPVAALVLDSFLEALLLRIGAPGVLLDVAFAASVVLAILGTAPAFCGRMRLSGLTLTGQRPEAREVLHFYTSPTLWWRSVLLFALHLFAICLPYAVAALGILGASVLFSNVVTALAVVGALLLIIVSLALGALTFLLMGNLLPALGIGIGNPTLSVMETLRASFRTAKGHMREIAYFRWRNMLHILLSLLTVGVLYVLYYAHIIQLAYLDLCIGLKGDPQ